MRKLNPLLRMNNTPVNERILPSGAANYWRITYEQHVAGTVKGRPMQGIDFEKRYDRIRKPN